MEDLDTIVAAAIKKGADYCDVRFVVNREEDIRVRGRDPEKVSSKIDQGYGVRVLMKGAWGFAAGQDPEQTAARAVKVARGSVLAKKEDVKLSDLTPYTDSWKAPIKKDPFSVPMEEKLSLLLDCGKTLIEHEDVKVAQATMRIRSQEKWFLSSEGATIHQDTTFCGAGISATVVKGGDMQKRSYPTSFDGNFSQQGYEFVEALSLYDHCEETAREAIQLVDAEPCPSGTMDIVLDSSQLALQVHESCGHPTELDRVLGFEASYAGTSFLTQEKLGHYTYGSPSVTIVADSTTPGGLGTFGYDDEGVKACRTVLVDKGIFSGYLTSRETAYQMGEKSNGAMRATDFNFMPIIRMTNINLMPGDYAFEELLEDIQEGIYMQTNRSWSIDDRRINFQFGCEIGYKITDGELTDMVKNPSYTALTPEFWGACDAVSKDWQLWGVPNCGKGEPSQTMFVGHGAAPARFRNMKTGVG
ncbi:MAG: TldD/PmbA family protein [Theionarchaea archaeon]|nr:TldD/PmbA family protein [Theionarchaea archaeon]MBU7001976.1 TldD/PmbA family protein [Theionarchaea archaeon]MBU7019773.1 TldD/PmbA family protein [Theionarchaea archaeon]MBU7034607.1 TldD/PmbA family protein [Theionarchaea archaeon]MBU7041303.1 TldD/PmbA family protein [Theionarchaea archaeon]